MSDATVDRLDVAAYTIPTDAPEADGTAAWDATTVVVVEAHGGDQVGLGYSYAAPAAATVVEDILAGAVCGRRASAVPAAWRSMADAVRNAGRPGVASHAIAAVDVALWDLHARLLDVPLVELLGRVHEQIDVYGSGGFTSYDDAHLAGQLAGWVREGIPRVKMKIGSEPDRDPHRVRVARDAIGAATELYVDANGAYTREQALALAQDFAAQNVTWFEEPVSSDDLEGLRLMRDRAPAGMAIAAGEYGYDVFYFRRMLEAGAVGTLQADVTRCGGITELLRIGALCWAHGIPLSAHTAPSIHAHAMCAIDRAVHIEWFHDHVRIERMLFDGVLEPREGALRPGDRPGLGLELRRREAEPHTTGGA